MAFAIDYRRILVAMLVVASTSTLVYFGNGLNPFWPLLWFAPLPVLLFAARSSRWATALTAFGVFIASRISRMESFQVVMQLVLLPMLFLSGAMFPQRRRAAVGEGDRPRARGRLRGR